MNSSSKIRQLTRLAILVAIIFLLSFIRPFKLTLVQIPVIIGATLLGPAAGAILGFFFGLSEYIQALEGAQLLTTSALNYAPFAYTLVCFIPRILMGWLTGLLAHRFKSISEKRRSKQKKFLVGGVLHHGLIGFIGSMLNTVLYLGSFLLLLKDVLAAAITNGMSVIGYVLVLVCFFGLAEAFVSALVVPAVCRAMEVIFRRQPAPKH